MPSQFQPYYPRVAAQPVIQQKSAATGAPVSQSLGNLMQAIQKAKAADTLANQQADPDPDWLYTGASPSTPGSYY